MIPEEVKKAYTDKMVHTVTHGKKYLWKKDTTIQGIDCINNPIFREIFGEDTLPADQSLEIKHSAVLFTDIKGSTGLYEKLGDAKAYKLVREHFNILFNAIREHNGVPIKTIGDAVMGVFTSDRDSVNAAIDIQKEIQEFNKSAEHETPIEVKLGIHTGPVLVVTLNNRLDYFGSTVNIAARVQNLSHPGDIVLTDTLFEAPGIKTEIKRVTDTVKKRNVTLKGLKHKVKTYRIEL